MSVFSRIRLPVWTKLAKVATPAPSKLRFSTVAPAVLSTPLNSSRLSQKQHIEVLLHDNSWKKLSTQQILAQLTNVRSSSLTQRAISQCIDSKTVTPEEFVAVLKCYSVSNDFESVLNFYKSTVEARPELQSVSSLTSLLLSIKDESYNLELLEIYQNALNDPEHFPTLRGDIPAAGRAVVLYAYIPSESKVPAHLPQALALRDMLLAEGRTLDANFYRKLILACNTHGNYAMARDVYAEAVSGLDEPHLGLETALLKAALGANQLTDCLEIYERLMAARAPLDDRLTLTMLEAANKMQSKELAVGIAKPYLKAGGTLTWEICDEILKAVLDNDVRRALSPASSVPAAHLKFPHLYHNKAKKVNAVVGAADAAPLSPQQIKAVKHAAINLQDDCNSLVRKVVRHTQKNLYTVLGRALGQQHERAENDHSLYTENTSNITRAAPIRVVSKLAALLADFRDMGVELVLQRVELMPSTFPSPYVQKAAHLRVVHTLALDLMRLNRWRELLALGVRLEGYRRAADTLYYTPGERAAVETYTAVALIRDQRLDRAVQVVSTRLVACLREAAADQQTETIAGVLQALHHAGEGRIMSTELAVVLRHTIPLLEPVAAQQLVTETLLSTTSPKDIERYLQALEQANAATEGVTHDYKLADHQLDIVQAVLNAGHSAFMNKHLEGIRTSLVSLTTPLTGV